MKPSIKKNVDLDENAKFISQPKYISAINIKRIWMFFKKSYIFFPESSRF